MLLEPVAGTALFPMIIGWTAYANHLTKVSPRSCNQAAIAVEIVAWIAQFVGHGVYEKRAPALLDNLLQAFVLAPFFVFIEGLFMLGYRPELQRRVNQKVIQEVKKYKASKEATNGSAKNERHNKVKRNWGMRTTLRTDRVGARSMMRGGGNIDRLSG